MAKSDERSLGLAARKILADMAKSRSEPIGPAVVEAFIENVGGPQGYAEILSGELDKARGKIDPANAGHYKPSQHMTFKLLELTSRIFLLNDHRESGDFSGMTDEELVNTLRGLAVDLVRTNEGFRRLIAIEAVRVQPDLIHELMTESGMPVLEPDKVATEEKPPAIESAPAPYRDAGFDEDDAYDANDN